MRHGQGACSQVTCSPYGYDQGRGAPRRGGASPRSLAKIPRSGVGRADYAGRSRGRGATSSERGPNRRPVSRMISPRPSRWISSWLGAMCLVAEGCAALLRCPLCQSDWSGLLEPYAKLNAQVGLAFCLGPVSRFLGSLTALSRRFRQGRADSSPRSRRSKALGAVTTEALAQCEYGELLLAGARAGATRAPRQGAPHGRAARDESASKAGVRRARVCGNRRLAPFSAAELG